ncbi:hypothetical protein CCAX7_54070 [Capsulimonas corticalis]|uniref:Uncharacterized protein n=1 Tax=Capsulimonas corticalis TaxID=2219043 RepID=A0A402CNK8_9BACT|nr:hypothetical protein [Capsulimonas corticalis]BDI33356.1 hypothetical protein CCAX7_54070 [Capsulimonas corticalis]
MKTAPTISGRDISPDFRQSEKDAKIAREVLKYAGTPAAIRHFNKSCKPLTTYAYWHILSTLWVSYTGFSDLEMWKKLFSSPRKNRETSLMKPSEFVVFRQMPDQITVYRAHRPGETDWIAYTVAPQTAARFAYERGADCIHAYQVDKADVLALFLRRGEQEILVLDKSRVQFVREIEVVIAGSADTAGKEY